MSGQNAIACADVEQALLNSESGDLFGAWMMAEGRNVSALADMAAQSMTDEDCARLGRTIATRYRAFVRAKLEASHG